MAFHATIYHENIEREPDQPNKGGVSRARLHFIRRKKCIYYTTIGYTDSLLRTLRTFSYKALRKFQRCLTYCSQLEQLSFHHVSIQLYSIGIKAIPCSNYPASLLEKENALFLIEVKEHPMVDLPHIDSV